MESLNSLHELSLDFKPAFIPKTITRFLKEVSEIGSVNEKVLQVDDFVDRLEMEMNKIEAFNQEVPLCMFLINDAILALKEESVVLKRRVNVEPVLEEFIPLKNSYDEDGNDVKVEIIANQKDNSDKKNWLSSTHLWNTNENLYEKPNSIAKTFKKRDEEDVVRRSIFSPEIRRSMRGNGFLSEIDCKSRLIPSATPNVESNIRIGVTMPVPPQQHTSRKLRRCWSTELHRRFVNALQQLGGSQVATPKQIRELMQVDGLTNDEVKSHLQKYRLHTRRLPSLNKNQSVRSSKCSNSQSGSPDGPLTNGGNNMDDHEDEKSENYY